MIKKMINNNDKNNSQCFTVGTEHSDCDRFKVYLIFQGAKEHNYNFSPQSSVPIFFSMVHSFPLICKNAGESTSNHLKVRQNKNVVHLESAGGQGQKNTGMRRRINSPGRQRAAAADSDDGSQHVGV